MFSSRTPTSANDKILRNNSSSSFSKDDRSSSNSHLPQPATTSSTIFRNHNSASGGSDQNRSLMNNMHNNHDDEDDTSPPSVAHRVISVRFIRRRIIYPLLVLFPVVSIFIPPVIVLLLHILLRVIDYTATTITMTSKSHTATEKLISILIPQTIWKVLFILFTTRFFLRYISEQVVVYAPSKDQRIKALKMCNTWKFKSAALAFVWILVCCALHIIIFMNSFLRVEGRTSDGANNDGSIRNYSSLEMNDEPGRNGTMNNTSWKVMGLMIGIRMGLSTFILGLAVSLKFVGCFSIVQCSCIPLPRNPLDTFLRSVNFYFTNPPQIYEDLMHYLSPDDYPYNINNGNNNYNNNHNNTRTSTMRKNEKLGNVMYRNNINESNNTKIDSNNRSQPQPTQKHQQHQHFADIISQPLRIGERRRYRRPEMIRCIQQFIIYAVAGCVFCNIVLSPDLPSFYPASFSSVVSPPSSPMMFVYVSCSLLSTMTLYLTTLHDSSSHEVVTSVKPGILRDRNGSNTLRFGEIIRSIFSEVITLIRTCNLIPVWATVPTLSWIVFKAFDKRVNLVGSCDEDEELIKNVSFPFLGSLSSNEIITMLKPLIIAYLAGAVLSVYLLFCDVIARSFVVLGGSDLDKLVNRGKDTTSTGKITNSSTLSIPYSHPPILSPEQLAVEVILAGFGQKILFDVTSVHPLPSSTSETNRLIMSSFSQQVKWWYNSNSRTQQTNAVEEEEIFRNFFTINLVALSILRGAGNGNLTIEDDAIRFVVLESLGGTVEGGKGKKVRTSSGDIVERRGRGSLHLWGVEGKPSGQTLNALVRRVHASDREEYINSSGAGYHPTSRLNTLPPIIPVVRALCAYAGGLGEALRRCSRDEEDVRELKNGVGPIKWYDGDDVGFYLPPCAAIAVANAIRAAASLIWLGLVLPPAGGKCWDRSKPLTRGRRHRLPSMSGMVLKTVELLKAGVLCYALRLEGGKVSGGGLPGVGGAISKEAVDSPECVAASRRPDLARILVACDESVNLIERTLSKVDGPRG